MRTASIITIGAGAIVRSAGAGVPGIKVRAQHYDFIFFVGPGNFRDGVILRSSRPGSS